MQRKAHEILRTKAIEKLVVEPEGSKNLMDCRFGRRIACTPLKDRCLSESHRIARLGDCSLPKGKPGCRNRKQVFPIASIHEARECSCQIQAVAFGAESRNRCVSAFQDVEADVNGCTNKRGNQHECKGQNEQQMENAPPRTHLAHQTRASKVKQEGEGQGRYPE